MTTEFSFASPGMIALYYFVVTGLWLGFLCAYTDACPNMPHTSGILVGLILFALIWPVSIPIFVGYAGASRLFRSK